LPTDHKSRKNRKDVFVSRVERDVVSPLPSGEELYDLKSEYNDIVFGFQFSKQKFLGFGLTYNWVKRSIFWELSYLKTNILRHNLDLMHIEKNVFENIFNTFIDMKGKTKDNIKARMNIYVFCQSKNIELVYDGSWVIKPKVNFALDKNAQLFVYQWLKSLYFSDGHALDMSRLVNLEGYKLYRMKSYDYHMFMQTLIPLDYQN
jgi:hypothetical protein